VGGRHGGLILHSSDGGATWQQRNPPVAEPATTPRTARGFDWLPSAHAGAACPPGTVLDKSGQCVKVLPNALPPSLVPKGPPVQQGPRYSKARRSKRWNGTRRGRRRRAR
jgi:hypothetical protein